jgi:hypothetical protein
VEVGAEVEVGAADGTRVGVVAVGMFVSPTCDGVEVGAEVEVGAADGTRVGVVAVGVFVSPTCDGVEVGAADGAKVCVAVGVFVSPTCDGVEVGADVGAANGTKVGVLISPLLRFVLPFILMLVLMPKQIMMIADKHSARDSQRNCVSSVWHFSTVFATCCRTYAANTTVIATHRYKSLVRSMFAACEQPMVAFRSTRSKYRASLPLAVDSVLSRSATIVLSRSATVVLSRSATIVLLRSAAVVLSATVVPLRSATVVLLRSATVVLLRSATVVLLRSATVVLLRSATAVLCVLAALT